MVEEQINQSVRVQTEFEEWVEGGCKKAEDLIKDSEKKDSVQTTKGILTEIASNPNKHLNIEIFPAQKSILYY